MMHNILAIIILLSVTTVTLSGIGCVAKIIGTTFKNPEDAFKYALGSLFLLPIGFTSMAAFTGSNITSAWRFPVAFAIGLFIAAMMFSFSGTWHLLRPKTLKDAYVRWVNRRPDSTA